MNGVKFFTFSPLGPAGPPGPKGPGSPYHSTKQDRVRECFCLICQWIKWRHVKHKKKHAITCPPHSLNTLTQWDKRLWGTAYNPFGWRHDMQLRSCKHRSALSQLKTADHPICYWTCCSETDWTFKFAKRCILVFAFSFAASTLREFIFLSVSLFNRFPSAFKMLDIQWTKPKFTWIVNVILTITVYQNWSE